MTKSEYAEYKAAVAAFFEAEGITHLTTGHPWCPHCGREDGWWAENGKCVTCGSDRDTTNEGFVSSAPCDCCGSGLQGTREHATGSPRKGEPVYEYTICVDCVYFTEYGRLDDTTMSELED